MKSTKRLPVNLLTALFLLTTVTSVHAQGSMIRTPRCDFPKAISVDREALKSMLSDEGCSRKNGVKWAYPLISVEQRINSLTADELAYFQCKPG